MNTEDRRLHLYALALAGVAAIFFLVFVYGYPWLFGPTDASDPAYFDRHVADALSRGNFQRALKLTRYARDLRPLDPMTHTAYGRVLLKCRDLPGALESLDTAIRLQKDPMPPYRATHKPYYFAPARLTLGKYYLDQGALLEAIAHFELARGYGTPADAGYRDFHPSLHRAYSLLGLWARALEFGECSDRELDPLDSEEIVRIARICEGMQNWTLAGRLAQKLLNQNAFTAEAHYLMGRAELAHKQYEAAALSFEQAVSDGHEQAGYFLGATLCRLGQADRACQAFLRTPPGSLYRPFALARALALLADLPEDAAVSLGTGRRDLLDQLDHEIAAIRLSRPLVAFDRQLRLVPIAVTISEAHVASGGRFPLIILWEDKKPPAVSNPDRLTFAGSDAEDTLELFKGRDVILQLQWVDNLVYWYGVERLESGACPVPGWTDTPREWFGLRRDCAARVQRDDAGRPFLSITKPTWLYSVPIRVDIDRSGYMLAGWCRGTQSKAQFSWQAMDRRERTVLDANILGREDTEEWTWHGGYIRPRIDWNAIYVHLDVLPSAGTVSFDDILLVKIREPDLGLLRTEAEHAPG